MKQASLIAANARREPVLKPTALYLGDNGRCYCGAHAGMSAAYTGRDISGQEVLELTADLIVANGFDCDSFHCETCGRSVS
jgi:hypothetical protein